MTAPQSLPPTLRQGGATSESERAAADLLRRAFDDDPASHPAPHPAVGERMWRELEGRLHDGPPPRWRAWSWLAGAVPLAAGAVLLIWAVPERPQGNYELVRGELVWAEAQASASATTQRGSAAEEWSKGEPVRCATAFCELRSGGVRAVLSNDAVFSLRPVAEPSVTGQTSRDQTAIIHRGAVSFAVEPLPPGHTFAVQSNETLVEVVGTAFRVENDEHTRVVVTEGTVRVTHRGEVTYVRAGELWNQPRGGKRTGLEQAAAMPSTDLHRLVEALGEAPAAAPAPSAPSKARTPASEPVQPVSAAPVLPEDPSPLLRRAHALAEAGVLDKAQEIYQDLASRSGTSGELGLYYMAKFELRNLHAPEKAQSTLEAMRARYPNGTLQVERHLTEIEAWLARRRCPEAQTAQEAFRERFGGSQALLEELRPMMEAAGCSR